MICKICKQPVLLVPSAAERAKKYGGEPKDYEFLFPVHFTCFIREREKETLELMRRKNSDGQKNSSTE